MTKSWLGAQLQDYHPQRSVRTDAFTRIRDTNGCSLSRFKENESDPGSLVVYERNAAYGLTAGPKLPKFERIEWHIITDASTAAAALQTGEIDWFEQPPLETQLLLKRNRQIAIEAIDPLPLVGVLRFNHLYAPFNDNCVRQALLPTISQRTS